jgi:glycerol-1-phosphate dehydrogenase [NAD(P)+]
VPTEYYRYEDDAIARLPEVIGDRVQNPEYVIIADTRTFEVAGKMVAEALTAYGAAVERFIVPDTNGASPRTDEKTKDMILENTPDAEGHIAVGSGVINDLTKWVAYDRNRPYWVVATAASMNGYTAANVAASIDSLKTLFHARACKGVFAVPAIIENAPFELTSAGLGDAVAKSVSSLDWKLNHILFNEYYCQYALDLSKELEPIYFEDPHHIRNRKPEAIHSLFEALFLSGVAMTITETSAPASGGEHLISHTIDMISSLKGQEHDFHGRQTGLGAIITAALYEKVLSMKEVQFTRVPQEVDYDFWGPLSPVVAEEYKNKLAKYELAKKKLSSAENWDHLRMSLIRMCVPVQKIKNCLRTAGAAHRLCDLRRGDRTMQQEIFLKILKNAHQMRDRFTILDLALLFGIMPGQAEEIISEWVLE